MGEEEITVETEDGNSQRHRSKEKKKKLKDRNICKTYLYNRSHCITKAPHASQ
jgi:hypothetical protein